MLNKLTIDNFQDHAHSEINFAPITLVIGPNFAGKSAVLRALKALITNATGDEWIQQGEDQARVTVHDSDTTEIIWLKARGKSGEYTLDWSPDGDHRKSQQYVKTGGQVPEDVAAALGIREVEVGDLSLWPQVQQQFDPPFLLAESGNKLARVLGRLTRLDLIIAAQGACKKGRDGHRKAREQAQGEAERLLEQQATLPDVAELRADVTLLQDGLRKAEAVAEAIEQERYLAARLEQARRVKDIDLAPLRDRVERATVLLADLSAVRESAASLALARSTLSSAAQEVIRCAGTLDHARQAYRDACQAMGICSSCPYVEAPT